MSKSTTNADVAEKYDRYIAPVWKELNPPIASAENCTVTDFDGTEYLDAFAGISVTNVGHTNPAVTGAISEQLNDVMHACSYLHPLAPVADLAERIADISPGDLEKTFFCNSGTEAVEGAIKLARKSTGRTEIVSLEMAFHGRTLGSLALTGNTGYKRGMAPTLNDVAHAPAPYAYRCPRCEGDRCGRQCARELDRTIETATADDVAAIVIEPVIGEGGLIVPSAEWFAEIDRIADERGALLIVDEVQTGYGRTGKFWAVDHFDIEPDILLQAKGIANGLPLGAFTSRPEIADAFDGGDHYSTFGGNPVSCAAALATIEELEDGIIDHAASLGEWFEEELADIAAEYDWIGDSRGIGMMRGLEIVAPGDRGPRDVAPAPDASRAGAVRSRLQERGILVGVGGFYRNVIRIQPPLVMTNDEATRVVETLAEVCEAVDSRDPQAISR